MNYIVQLSSAAFCALLILSGGAYSQTASSNMGVSMTVAAECTISATDLDFPSVGIIDSNVDATAAITIQCTEGSAYEISLSEGGGSGATAADRKMTHDTDNTKTASYSLYQDDNHATVWGDGEGETKGSENATGADEVHTVYGRVFSGQNVPPGEYTDTITATITYGTSL